MHFIVNVQLMHSRIKCQMHLNLSHILTFRQTTTFSSSKNEIPFNEYHNLNFKYKLHESRQEKAIYLRTHQKYVSNDGMNLKTFPNKIRNEVFICL